ncbi:hypothetical protein VNI00_003050 [Paramarasmius palmivorus]|uniref:F-box domain-containing protein n=1 Tax=Paramarasmius palmivorus TaxID=297713 RepID=A0AAW0DUF7_9AGAR
MDEDTSTPSPKPNGILRSLLVPPAPEPESVIYLQSHRRTLAPIQTLPNDILREILLQWCRLVSEKDPISARQTQRPRKEFDSLDLTLPQWVCAQVCRSWRQAAFSCSHLWSPLCIYIPGPSDSDEKRKCMNHNLTSLLRWLGNRPLTVEVKSYYSFTHLDDVLLSTLCSHSSRWERLGLTMKADILGHLLPLLKAKILEVPLLHTLFLDFWKPPPEGIVLDVFENAPNLKRIVIADGLPNVRGVLKIPWHRITEIQLASEFRASGVDPLDHLMQSSGIVSYYDTQFACPQGPGIHLPLLRIMMLRITGLVEWLDFERFQTLNLTELRLRDGGTEGDINSLVAFLHRQGSTLRTLYLESSLIPEQRMIQVAEHLTALTSLSYVYRYPSSKSTLLSALIDLNLLPCLRSLLLYGCPAFVWKVMSSMLSARLSQGNGPFQKFGLPSNYIHFVKEDLERFKAQGLEIESTEGWDGSWLPGEWDSQPPPA